MTLPTECRWTIIFHGSVSEVLSSLLEPFENVSVFTFVCSF